MIRVAHLLRSLNVGGTEQMVLQLCRLRDRSRFACTVASPWPGSIMDEIRATGTPVLTGPEAFAAAAGWADVVLMHWWGPDLAMLDGVRRARKPHVAALHCYRVLPRLPVLTVCTSRHVYDIQEHRDRCVVIPNAADTSQFRPAERPDDGRVVITRVCRPSRCEPYFWPAMRRVMQRHPEVRLQIVGNPQPCTPPWPGVEFLGIRRDVPEILAASDLFVYCPGRAFGSQDLAALEATAAGLPCVVTDVVAVRDTVVDGVTGYRVPYGDVDALVERVCELVRDRDLRLRMGAAGARHARQSFDAGKMTRKYETVLKTVYQAAGVSACS